MSISARRLTHFDGRLDTPIYGSLVERLGSPTFVHPVDRCAAHARLVLLPV
jgi:hypothetical protein